MIHLYKHTFCRVYYTYELVAPSRPSKFYSYWYEKSDMTLLFFMCHHDLFHKKRHVIHMSFLIY